MSSATKKPSLYARKLVEKLRTLNSNASLESRQTLANWMLFNRKKAEGMGEGILLAINSATATTMNADDNNDGASSSPEGSGRLLLLLRVLHQVFMEGKDDSEAFEKSSHLRSTLADVALIPLFQALANIISFSSEQEQQQEEKYQTEIKDMIDSWKEYNVFDGPTVWEGYKKAWGRALVDTKKEKNTAGVDEKDKAAQAVVAESAATTEPMDVEVGGQQSTEGVQQTPPTPNTASSTKEIDETSKEDATEGDSTMAEKAAAAAESTIPTSSTKPVVEKRDSTTSVASIDIDYDAEGVEEAEVEPAKFLEASKVIASLQIARDLGSDAAMNLSSALGSVPKEVEQACATIFAQQQQEGGEVLSIEELLSTEHVSNLPDEILDIDLDYAKKSLHTYREAILQQRKARLQCLHLLLQSRCSFGSLDAARAFGCDDGSDEGMDIVLEKLKKMKEKLIDAMALEGLDVEEDDADEKKMKEEEEQLKHLSWFPGQTKESEEEPASKKQKVA